MAASAATRRIAWWPSRTGRQHRQQLGQHHGSGVLAGCLPVPEAVAAVDADDPEWGIPGLGDLRERLLHAHAHHRRRVPALAVQRDHRPQRSGLPDTARRVSFGMRVS